MDTLPPFVRAERDALIAEIHEAFAGVSRVGGVSWSEAYEIDMWRPPEEEQAARQDAARAQDLDTHWEQLVEDPEWHGDAETSAWSFLDGIGFRYYLPAAMARGLQQGWSHDSVVFSLTLSEDSLQGYDLDKWSPLDARQRRCIKRFIEYMIVLSGDALTEDDLWDWRKAYASHWKGVPDDDRPTATRPRSRRNARSERR